MFKNFGPVSQALIGTIFTWGLTAAGAALVVFFNETQQKLLDCSLGFAAGVMLAASYWSLLEPAIDMAKETKMFGANGEFSFVPVAVGFFVGALFVYLADISISYFNLDTQNMILALNPDKSIERRPSSETTNYSDVKDWTAIDGFTDNNSLKLRKRGVVTANGDYSPDSPKEIPDDKKIYSGYNNSQWKRMLLLIVAITVHNIPEGLAVGVGFGAVGSSMVATFENARNLAIGIGIQNFPEGLAVSLPLKAAGFSTWKSFWYGQLSGMVEPIFGVLGAAAVSVARPILPYALAFAAGAMVYVVMDDIVPEANTNGNGRMASWSSIIGFLIMMALDVGLG